MKNPKISIIMPIYNVEKYLRKCFDSILVSTLQEIEIIAVDDGATDFSGQIIDEYAIKDSRIIPIHKQNGGYGSAINEGLKIARGEFVAILETDDWIAPNMYEILYNKAKELDVDCLKGNFYYCPNENTNIEHRFLDTLPIEAPFKFKDHIELLLLAPSIWSAIYKREFLEQKNIKCTRKVTPYEDLPFALEVYSKVEKIALIDNRLYFYRCEPRQGSSTIRNDRKLFKIIEQIQNTIDISKEVGSFDYVKETLYKHIYNSMLLFVGNVHKDLKKELFCEFGNFFKANNAKDLKYTFFNKLEKKIVNALIKHNYFYFKNLKTISYLKRHPLLINSEMMKNIFSIKNEGGHKVFRILGVKFKVKNKFNELSTQIKAQTSEFKNAHNALIAELNHTKNELYNSKNELQFTIKKIKNEFDDVVMDLFQERNFTQNIKDPFNLEKCLDKIHNPNYLIVDSNHNYLNILLDLPEFFYDENATPEGEIILCWEIARWKQNIDIIKSAIKTNKKIITVGDGFLRSMNTMVDANELPKYKKGISFTIDDLTPYYDATRASRMELMLNDRDLILTDEQKQRARACIDKIVETHLTKYNHQPIFEPKIGRDGVKKVLVVDQTYGDMSIKKGLANEETFNQMLEAAIKENPDADIIIKTHPDTMAGAGGYYKGLEFEGNIYPQTEPINPISLIKYVDKVYVCTTQFGFEALMCEKEVHVFGMPFYAGWGLTNDRQKCERRTNTRTLEEMFYIAYIMYSHYVNPDKKCRCEIEEAIGYLIELRKKYFEEIGVNNEDLN